MKPKTVLIVGPDGKVRYRRPPDDALVQEAEAREGYCGITPEQHEILRHSVGLSNGLGQMYRNFFAAEGSGPDYENIKKLVARGLMREGRLVNSPPDELRYYHVTDKGKVTAAEPVLETGV